jgi:hypothetical protein
MPHVLHYRALGGETFLDGTPKQSEDEVYQAFLKQNGCCPDGILSVDENEQLTVIWSEENDEDDEALC